MRNSDRYPLMLELKHTGERLELRRFRNENGSLTLELKGSLPARSEGPPLHVHHREDEGGKVISGTVSALVDGKTVVAGPGESVSFPRGCAHRWWNDGDEKLVFEGFATPLVDFDRYLQAVFEVVNAGPAGRPPLFYMAHVLRRHRRTQQVLIVPKPVQLLLFPIVIFIGTVLGKYRGTEWPGCPARCSGAPLVTSAEALP